MVQVFVQLFAFINFYSLICWYTAKSSIWYVLFSLLTLVFWPGLDDTFIYQSLRILRVLFSKTDSGLCIYHDQVLIFCTIFNEPSFPPSQTYSCISFVSFAAFTNYAINLFFLCHLITYTCYSSVYHQFLLWHNLFLCHFELRLIDI